MALVTTVCWPGRHWSEGFIVVGSSGAKVRHELELNAMKTTTTRGMDARIFMGLRVQEVS